MYQTKKTYKCPARELYSESPWFREAYCYAKLVADRIFILSAKYGLVPENMIIEPYNETLRYKKVEERREWGEMVLNELGKVSDLEHDEFIVLAGRFYYENLLPHLGHVKLPLGGVRQGGQIPELRRLVMNEMESNNAMVLHILFNDLPRFDWTMIDQIPYRNGIYVMFEKGESYHSMDRIVRIGTNRGQDRLLERLRDHFVKEDADSSILRKKIGRAFLNMGLNPYLQVWEIDMHYSENIRNFGHLINKELDTKLEARISEYLRKNITFICIPVDEEAERLRLEEGLIASLTMDPSFGPSSNWLGLNSPMPEIARSGLWNSQHLQGKPLSPEELERVKQLARSGSR
ncbi:MAG: DUF6884 domain-containing protein [Rectinema sp.]